MASPVSKSFLVGLASGYATIAVQALTGLLLIPYLLSRHGVGLAGYGVIAAIQAAAAMVTVALDGHRQDSSRRLATWVEHPERSSYFALLTFTLLVTSVLAVTGVLLASPLASWLELGAKDAIAGLRLAFICVVLEQSCYIMENSLHAGRRSWVANALGAGDAMLRAVLVVSLFTVAGASIEWFFVAALVSLGLKTLLLVFACRHMIIGAASADTLRAEARQFLRSLPLSLNGLAPYLVFRLSIIAGNKILGAQQAGVLAIVLVTVRTYLNQAIFSAMRPMLVPRLAIGALADPRSAVRQQFIGYLNLYHAAVYAVGITVVCATPVWLPLWLGEELRPYSAQFMAAIAIYFVEIGCGVAYYCLVAHERAGKLALGNGLAAAVACAILLGASRLPLSLWAYVLVVVAYLATYALLVRHHFRRRLAFSVRDTDIELVLAVAAGSAGAWLALARGSNVVEVLALTLAATLIFLTTCHFAVTPLRIAAGLLTRRSAPR